MTAKPWLDVTSGLGRSTNPWLMPWQLSFPFKLFIKKHSLDMGKNAGKERTKILWISQILLLELMIKTETIDFQTQILAPLLYLYLESFCQPEWKSSYVDSELLYLYEPCWHLVWPIVQVPQKNNYMIQNRKQHHLSKFRSCQRSNENKNSSMKDMTSVCKRDVTVTDVTS